MPTQTSDIPRRAIGAVLRPPPTVITNDRRNLTDLTLTSEKIHAGLGEDQVGNFALLKGTTNRRVGGRRSAGHFRPFVPRPTWEGLPARWCRIHQETL